MGFGNLDVLASCDFHCYLANQHTTKNQLKEKQKQSLRELRNGQERKKPESSCAEEVMSHETVLNPSSNEQTVPATTKQQSRKKKQYTKLMEAKSLRI